MRVWRAAPDEAPAVAALLGAFRDHLGYAEPDDASLLASVERIIVRDDAEYLLAGQDEPRGVAQVRYRWSVWWSAEDCWLEDLYVSAGGARDRPRPRAHAGGDRARDRPRLPPRRARRQFREPCRARPVPVARLRHRQDRGSGPVHAPTALASRTAGSLARAQREAGPDQLPLAQMQVALRRQHLLDVRRANRLERRGGHGGRIVPFLRILNRADTCMRVRLAA